MGGRTNQRLRKEGERLSEPRLFPSQDKDRRGKKGLRGGSEKTIFCAAVIHPGLDSRFSEEAGGRGKAEGVEELGKRWEEDGITRYNRECWYAVRWREEGVGSGQSEGTGNGNERGRYELLNRMLG